MVLLVLYCILYLACQASYCIDEIGAFACKVLFTCVCSTCNGAGYLSASFQVWIIPAFIFVLAGIPYAISYSNFNKGYGSVGDIFQLVNVPDGVTIGN